MVNAWTHGVAALLIAGLTGCNTFDPPPNRNFDTEDPFILGGTSTKGTVSSPPIVTTLGVSPLSTVTNTSTGASSQGSTASATGSGVEDDSIPFMTDAGEEEGGAVGPSPGTGSTDTVGIETSGSADAATLNTSNAAQGDAGGSADASSPDFDAGLIDADGVDAGSDASE